MKSLVHFQGKDFNFGTMILEKMDTILGEWRNNPTGDKTKVEEAIHHTSAFLISEPNLNRKLLRALARIPVKCLTTESVRRTAGSGLLPSDPSLKHNSSWKLSQHGGGLSMPEWDYLPPLFYPAGL
eukprot:sb/3475589/